MIQDEVKYLDFKGTVQQLNFGLFENFFFDLIYLSSSGEHISFWYIPCFGPPNKSYSRVKGRILCWKHNQPKFKSFLTLQPHWKHSGQQNFFSDLLVIIEIRHVFFNMHLFQFIEMLQPEISTKMFPKNVYGYTI